MKIWLFGNSEQPLSMVRLKINAALPQMGLTSTSLPNKVRKADVEIGKNYLNEEEIEKDS
ncbi:virulence RhuM family protein [Bacteroides oleiciplenus]|uniref:virulence RhuM family protein n=1 Tax=Bacteroides oleiciplenus TaxID=626931 RepID=UPI0005C55C2C|nr:virulence RhuM family protein [Bacteroides oleiciplenus]